MTIWLISDTHFYHAAMLGFLRPDGTRVRHEFDSVDQMNATMIERWNAAVKPQDHVYHLGDVSMKVSSTVTANLVRSLHGHKRLVRGNHDRHTTSQYLRMGFEEIHGMKLLSRVWLTHAPLHPTSLGRALGNVHGHIHAQPSPSGPYLNVCVEQTDYAPISLEQAEARLSQIRASEDDDHHGQLSQPRPMYALQSPLIRSTLEDV